MTIYGQSGVYFLAVHIFAGNEFSAKLAQFMDSKLRLQVTTIIYERILNKLAPKLAFEEQNRLNIQ